MANGDVDAVHRFYAAWTAGDLPRMLAEVDAEVEAQPILGLLYERPSSVSYTHLRAHET